VSNSSSSFPGGASQSLPDRPNLQHLKNQARDLLRAGSAASLADAQFQVARMYGFASWPKLEKHMSEIVAAIEMLKPGDYVALHLL